MLSRRAQRGRHRHRWHAGHLRQDLTIRYWHPGFWWALGGAVLRQAGILGHLCRACGGSGRVVKAAFLRRRACPVCRGTGTNLEDEGLIDTLMSLIGLSTRQSVRDSIAASPAGPHEGYPAGSIVICVSCAAPLYRLERGIAIGEKAGRTADAYRPVRVQDLIDLRARAGVNAGVRAILQAQSLVQLQAHCDRIPELHAGDALACPICTRAFVAVRSSRDPKEVNETLQRGYVLELVTIPPSGRQAASLGSAKRARELVGIRR